MSRSVSIWGCVRLFLYVLALSTCLSWAQIMFGQIGRVPVVVRSRARLSITQPAADVLPDNYDFKKVSFGAVGLQRFNLPVGKTLGSVDIRDDSGADPSQEYKYELADKDGHSCTPSSSCTALVIGFMPSDDHSSVSATLSVTFVEGGVQFTKLTGQGTTSTCISPSSKRVFLPLSHSIKLEDIYSVQPSGIGDDLATKVFKDFGDPYKKLLVNCYYSTNSLSSYFNQFQSIYNAASGATTLNANIASLNFVNGMQLTLGTNPQVGSTSGSSTPGTISPAGVPTLSSSGAAQAAQNMLNGGTIFGSDLLPILSRQSNGLITLSGEVREGVDLQKFNNTSTTASNPSTHTFVGLEGYLQYNSSNNAPNSSDPAGSIFLGGKYGYGLANHSYSVGNGFGGRVNYQLAQLSAGVLVNGVIKIAAYRGFGPSQKFIDGTAKTQKIVNNFQTWSIAIAYQSSSGKK